MPTTPAKSIYYPALSDAPNGPLAMELLAESVDTALVAISGGTTPAFGSAKAGNAYTFTTGAAAVPVALGYSFSYTGTVTHITNGFTVGSTGWYQISVSGRWAASSGNAFNVMSLRTNAAASPTAGVEIANVGVQLLAGGGYGDLSFSKSFHLTTGDTVELFALGANGQQLTTLSQLDIAQRTTG